MAAREGPFRFEGFSSPNGTIVPDEFFDVLAPELSEAQLRVCLYIIRRTFGFKKQSDEISLRQMVDGIRTKEGRVLDRGAGVVKSAAARAAKGLVEKGVVVAVRNESIEKGHEPTTYALRFRGTEVVARNGHETAGRTPLSSRRTRVVLQKDTPLSSKRTHKKQYLQETESSNGELHSTAKRSTGAGESLRVDDVIDELSLALGDTVHAASNRSQARKLYAQSGMPPEQFAARMYEALAVTKDRARDGDVGTKAAYFFAVLRDLLGLRERREHRAHTETSDRRPVPAPVPSPRALAPPVAWPQA